MDKTIKLDQFLKWVGATDSGGQAKQLILEQQVKVNDEIEVRRGRKLRPGDRVALGQQTWTVELP